MTQQKQPTKQVFHDHLPTPTEERVDAFFHRLVEHLSECPWAWTDWAEKLIQESSNGKYRVVQALYTSLRLR